MLPLLAAFGLSSILKKPKAAPVQAPTPPLPAPTFDDAARREETSRKFARRRGHLANARKGAGAQASVAVKQLLG